MRKNPAIAKSVLQILTSSVVGEANPIAYYPESFGGDLSAFSHLNSKDFTIYKGERVWWIGRRGHMLKLIPKKTTPSMTHEFDAKKLKAVEIGVQASSQPVVFYAPGVAPYAITQNFKVPTTSKGVSYIDLKPSDIGSVFLEVKDGCHRLFGALLSGEPYGWGILSPAIYNSYQDWLRANKPQNIYMAEEFNYLERNLM